MEQFGGDDAMVFSAVFRMMTLAKLIREGDLEGWVDKPREDGAALTHRALFAAAGQEPVRVVGEDLEFERSSFIQKAFQLAKIQ